MAVSILTQPKTMAVAGNPMLFTLRSSLSGNNIRFRFRVIIRNLTYPYGFSEVVSEDKPANSNKEAIFDAGKVLWDQLKADLPSLDTGVIKCPNVAREYRVQVWDYNETIDKLVEEVYHETTTHSQTLDTITLAAPLVANKQYKIVAYAAETTFLYAKFSDGTNQLSINGWTKIEDGYWEAVFTPAYAFTTLQCKAYVKHAILQNPPTKQLVIDKFVVMSRFSFTEFARLGGTRTLPSGTKMLHPASPQAQMYLDDTAHLYFLFQQLGVGINTITLTKSATDQDGNPLVGGNENYTLEPNTIYQYAIRPGIGGYFPPATDPKTVASITIKITSSVHTLLSKTYTVQQFSGDYRTTFAYQTMHGGFEILSATGERSAEMAVSHQELQQYLPAAYPQSFAQLTAHNFEVQETHKAWIGYKNREEYEALLAILHSRNVFVFKDRSSYLPVIILNKKAPIYSDANPLNTFEIEYKYAHNKLV